MVTTEAWPSIPRGLSDQFIVPAEHLPGLSDDYTLTAYRDVRGAESEGWFERRFRVIARPILPSWVPPVVRQLDMFLDLPHNWDSYGAPPPDPRLGFSALRLLVRVMHDNTPAPAIVPLSTGGLQLEWHQQGIDLEIEINEQHRFSMFFRDRRGGEEWQGSIGEDGGPLRQILGELMGRRQVNPLRAG